MKPFTTTVFVIQCFTKVKERVTELKTFREKREREGRKEVSLSVK